MRLGCTRVGPEDLAAADPTPQSPHIPDALLAESATCAMERLVQRFEHHRLPLLPQVQWCRVESNGDLHDLRQERG